MNDPWYTAAGQIRDQRTQAEQQEAVARQQQAYEEAVRREAENAAYQEMQAAIAEAVPQLTAFLNERGAAAQQLLAAYSDRVYISFGGYSEGGCYSNVYLSKDGLCHEVGVQAGYSSRPSRVEFASPQEAVEAFAREGVGHKNPERVRNIVSWLTERINGYMPK